MRSLIFASGILFLVFSSACFAHTDRTAKGAEVSVPAIGLEIRLADQQPIAIDGAWLHQLQRHTATAAAHDQPTSKWEGVAFVDVLRKAGAPLDQKLRGRELAKMVRVTASDGYQVIFSLAELDAAFSNTAALLVDTQDGHALGADGPYRLIVPRDKRPARWVSNVILVELLDVASVPETTP